MICLGNSHSLLENFLDTLVLKGTQLTVQRGLEAPGGMFFNGS